VAPATRAGALDRSRREALLRYVLRPPIGQERLTLLPDGLVRILLKKAYSDGTVGVDMDPLSLLCRLATSVPPPRLHTVRYSGVLAAGSRWRSRITPPAAPETVARLSETTEEAGRSCRGFSFFSDQDLNLLETVLRGENTIAGFRLIRKVRGTYKYYVTDLG
jgi:hypothetical protein